MKLLVLMGQRQCEYDGQYAPEAFEVMTEYGHDENPEFLTEKLAEARADSEIVAAEIVTLDVNDEAITRALFPERAPIKAIIVEGKP